MIIGIDANEANLTSNRVGINQFAFDLLKAIQDTHSNHEFIIYLKTKPLSDMPKEDEHWKYRVIPFPKFWTQTRLPFELYFSNQKPDIFLSLTHYAPRFCPMPYVVSIMDLGFLKTPEQFTKKDFTQLKSWTSYSVKRAKKIISISEFTKIDLIKYFGIDNNRIEIVYPSYDEELFKPTIDKNLLQKYGINGDYIFFLSSLKPSKNIEGLIKAFSILKEKNIKLVISGKKGWLYETIFSLVKELNLVDRIIFTGFIDEDDAPKLMSMSKCFVLPSFYEGFGIPILEAMACGVPVVVSNVASMPEVAGDAGIYVDPNDINSIAKGIERAIGPEKDKFVKAGLKRVKSFSWKSSAKKLLSILETIK